MPELIRGHTWDGEHRPRVVVEAAEWGAREQMAAALRAEGYEALTCPGPEGSGHRCTLAAGDGCRAAEEAHVVVHALGPWDLRNVEALRALRRRLPNTPVVVEVSAVDAARRTAELQGCVVVDAPCSPAEIVDAVARALDGRPGRADAGHP
jgi:DNA-binding NarL/FixJ family response regulator